MARLLLRDQLLGSRARDLGSIDPPAFSGNGRRLGCYPLGVTS